MTTSYRRLGRQAITVALLAWAASTSPPLTAQGLQNRVTDADYLPALTNFIVSFRSPTVWQIPRGIVVGAIVLMLAQAALIAGLLVQRARRRRVEAALRDSEAHFRATADTAPVMIWRSRLDQQCDFFNLPWLTFTGRSLEQELGDGWANSVHPDDLSALRVTYGRAFDAREPYRIEYRLRRFDGEYRWVLVTGVPRREPDGHFAGYIGSCLDITDRKQAEASLQEAQIELRHKSRLSALGEFAATIAHEIRQPLTAIIMNARSCLRGVGTLPELEDVRAGLLDVVEASQRAEEVIQRNRRLFRDRTVETIPLDINGVIRESVALTAARLAEGHVALATTLAEDLPTVGGDRIELQQVLLNLIGNAIDALEAVPPGSRRIDLSSSFDGQGVQVSVIDNGIGFDGVDLRRMFALSYTTKSTGTGVGLSISRSIIEAHGGKLWAGPNPGGGAIFSFSLPVRAGVAAAPPQLSTLTAQPPAPTTLSVDRH